MTQEKPSKQLLAARTDTFWQPTRGANQSTTETSAQATFFHEFSLLCLGGLHQKDYRRILWLIEAVVFLRLSGRRMRYCLRSKPAVEATMAVLKKNNRLDKPKASYYQKFLLKKKTTQTKQRKPYCLQVSS